MKMKVLFTAAAALAIAISAIGCSNQQTAAPAADEGASVETPAETQETQETEKTQEAPAQDTSAEAKESTSANPIAEYVGVYTAKDNENFNLLIEAADDADMVKVSVVLSDPEQPYTYWELYGSVDGSMKISYSDGGKFEIQLNDQGEPEDVMLYDDGTGTIQISPEGSITWKDDKEDAGKDAVFVWNEELSQQVREQMAQADDDVAASQNSTMNWAGPYKDTNNLSRTMMIQSGEEGTNKCTITVKDELEGNEAVIWTMDGEFNEETMTIEYENCVKKKGHLSENTEDNTDVPFAAKLDDEEVLYDVGTGRFVIHEENSTLTWEDDMEDEGKESSFVFSFDYGGFDTEGTTQEAAQEESAQ